MRAPVALAVLTLAAAPATAEVVVRVSGGQVELTASAAPLAEVLDRLARQTGMKVVYEGTAPRQLVTLSLHGRTLTETLLAVFEGLGVNFALVADTSGARVQTLVIAGTATATGTPSSNGSARPAAATARRPFGSPPGASPETMDPAFEDVDEEPGGDDEPFAGLPPGSRCHRPRGGPERPARSVSPQPRRGAGPASPDAGRPASSSGFALFRVAVHAAAAALPAAGPGPARGAAREPIHRRGHAARQPAASVTNAGYGRLVGPEEEGDLGVGKALPGCGSAGPTGRPTTRGWPGRNTHSL